jgi:hypothetical protein
VDASERRAILDGAAAYGVDPRSPGHRLLAVWLDREPSPELGRAWRELVGGLASALSVESRMELQRLLLGRARDVAEAAGGVLGFGAISRAEERVLAELDRAFEPGAAS